MKLVSRFATLLAWFAASVGALAQTPDISEAFVENRGQWDARGQFLARLPGLNMWINAEGATFDFHQFTRTNKPAQNPKLDRPEGILRGQVVKMSFENAHLPVPTGVSLQPGVFNYIRPKGTIKAARRFAEARSQDIYDGISARYYFDGGSPRYDLEVRPGADPGQIAIRLEGTEGLSLLPNGNLGIETSLGTVEERGLTVYQGQGTQRKLIPSRMIVDGNTLRFKLGTYDKSQALVIDPIIFSSYLGGTGGGGVGDRALAVTPPAYNGYIYTEYIAGDTTSADFPTTSGAYQTSIQGGTGQGFVAQVNAQGGGLIWCSFLEGTSLNGSAIVGINSAAVDGNDNVIVAGGVDNESFPTTGGAYQTTVGNTSVYSGFISKISSDGTTVLASTYLSGTTNDTVILGMCLDSVGNIMVTGRTQATDFPTTSGAIQTSNKSANGGAAGTAFASELSPDLTTLIGSTYVGGTGADCGYGVGDGQGDNLVVVGSTTSLDIQTSQGAAQNTNNASQGTGFVVTVTPQGGFYWGSYFGGSAGDAIYATFVDSTGDIVLAGRSYSTDLPVQPPAFQAANNANAATGFLALMNNSEGYVEYCTYLGGSGNDSILAIGPAADGVFVAGETTSTDFPTTPASYQGAGGGTSGTGFLAELSYDCSSLLYSTYYGSNTSINAISPGFNQNAFAAGSAGYVPTTAEAFQGGNNAGTGSTDAFFTEMTFSPETLTLKFPASSVVGGDAIVGSTVALSSPANESGATVTLKSDNPALSAQGTVFLPENYMSSGFNASTSVVSVATVVHLKATYNGASTTVPLTVIPHAIKSVTFGPASITGGTSVTGTVTLTGPAGGSAMTIELASGDTSKVKVPASMTIAAGKSAGTFTVDTLPVDATAEVPVKATNDAGSVSGSLTVKDPVMAHIAVVPSIVVGGAGSTGVITLSGNAGPSGVVVGLLSHNAAAAVPPSVKVPAGKNSVNFAIVTNPVDSNVEVAMTGTAKSTATNGYIEIETASLSGVSVSPHSVPGGVSSTGTVTLSAPAGHGGYVVGLSTSDSSLAMVPATAVIPQGQTKGTFAVKTAQVLANASVTVFAKLGSVTKSASLSLVPIQLSAFSVSPSTETGGIDATGTVLLTGPVGSTSIFVSVVSGDIAVAKPQYSQIDFGVPGESKQSFTVYTYPVDASTNVTLTASYNGIQRTASLIVNPAALKSLSLSPTSVVGGKPATGTVTLTGPAGPSGTVVSLQSGNAIAHVPASVTVPAGRTSVQFTVNTGAVKATTQVKLTADWNTLTSNATLTVTP